jgi:hypothetical protein
MYADFPEDTNGKGRAAAIAGRHTIQRDLGSDPNKFMVVDLRPVILQAVEEAKSNYPNIPEWVLGYEATKQDIIQDTKGKLQRLRNERKRQKTVADQGWPGAQKTTVPTRPGRAASCEEAVSTAIGRTFLFLIRLLATVIREFPNDRTRI